MVDGVSNIWVAMENGAGSAQVSGNTDASERLCCPAWSRDGKYIVFTSNGGLQSQRKMNRLWLYRLADREHSALIESTTAIRFLGFNDSGSEAFVAQAAVPTDSAAQPQAVNIILLSLSNRTSKQINTLDNTYLQNVHLSRDGRTIAFVSRRDDQTALWTVPVNGGTPKRILTENDPKILISSLAWTPDGNSIIFGKETRTNLLSMLAK
jgi:Tol biopolymer transport system component